MPYEVILSNIPGTSTEEKQSLKIIPTHHWSVRKLSLSANNVFQLRKIMQRLSSSFKDYLVNRGSFHPYAWQIIAIVQPKFLKYKAPRDKVFSQSKINFL